MTIEKIKELAEALPREPKQLAGFANYPEFLLVFDTYNEKWEIEFCPLEAGKNFTVDAETLEEVIEKAHERLNSQK